MKSVRRRRSRTYSCFEEINLEEIRRIRSLGGDLGQLGYSPYMVKISKRLSSKSFYKFK